MAKDYVFTLLISGDKKRLRSVIPEPNEGSPTRLVAREGTLDSIEGGCCCGCKCICTDLLFIIDTTGSMGNQIQAFRAAMTTVIEKFNSDTCKWGVADYKDFEDGGPYSNGWKLGSPFTDDIGQAQNAINALSPAGGGDGPEQNLAALYNAATQWTSIGGRPIDATCEKTINDQTIERPAKRAIVWAGDVIGHENGAKGLPYPSLQDTIASLVEERIKVIALGGGLGGQAGAITTATSGTWLTGFGTNVDEILDAICLALTGNKYTGT